MLRAWKDTSQSRHSHANEQVDYQVAQLQRACSGEPSSAVVDATSSGGAISGGPLARPSSVVGSKRTRGVDTDLDSTVKRRKHEPTPPTFSDPSSLRSRPSWADVVLEEAKIRNTITLLSSFDDAIELASSFLSWVASHYLISEQDSMSSEKISLIIVDQSLSPEDIARRLKSKTLLKVVSCSEFESLAEWSSLKENHVAIFSVKGLLEHLNREAITMSQLQSLVVFNANAAMRDSSALSNIIDQFYRTTSVHARPRILSLCYAAESTDLIQLEHFLDAKVAGISAIEKSILSSRRPTEVVVEYEPTSALSDTELTEQIRLLDPSESLFCSTFAVAHLILKELGPCASDRIWRQAMKDNIPMPGNENEDDSATRATEIRRLVTNWVFSMPNVHRFSRGFNVTPKFAKLVELLKACEPYGDRFRGIIYVQRREVATIMADMLHTLTDYLGFLRPLALTSQLSLVDESVQKDVYEGFSTGKYNLLIVTKSLEDLDIPTALLVVRYDVRESQLSYAYSCARTAKPFGYLVHMVKNGDDDQRRILSHFVGGKFDERWIDVVITGGNSSIPPRSLRERDQHTDLTDTNLGPYIEDPTASTRLYEENAVCALYRLVSSIYEAPQNTPKPLFVTRQKFCEGSTREWICDVLLPSELLAESISGPPRATSVHARRGAAFKACLQLYEHGIFDHRLFPPQKMPNIGNTRATSSDSLSGNRCYSRKRTRFWLNSIRLFSNRWFPVVICIQGPAAYAPVLLLTRQPLPRIAPFRLFIGGVPSLVQNVRGAPFEISMDRLHMLHLFTIRICRAILNKPFACDVNDTAYMFAPLSPSVAEHNQSVEFNRLLDYVLWDVVMVAGKEWAIRFTSEDIRSLQNVEDMVVQDRMVEFTRRYYALHLRRDLTPLSKPDDSPREAGYANFVEYCKARRKGFEGLQDYEQPMIEVARVAGVSNNLNPIFKPFAEPTRAVAKYLIPELSAKSTIPAGIFRTALLLPSIMRRIEDILIVHELNGEFFDHTIQGECLLAAISTPSASYETDYERLELFGDAFLKYLASIYVFVMNPTQHEGALHATRQRIISNKALMQSADRIGLPQFIQGKAFSYKVWQPPNFTINPLPASNATKSGTVGDESSLTTGCVHIHGSPAPPECEIQHEMPSSSSQATKKKSREDNVTQWLGDKTIADVVEAIIGAAYLSGGQEAAFQVTKALHVPIPHAEQWDDFRRKAFPPPSDPTAPLRAGTLEAVEAILGHDFRHPHVLGWALTHASVDGYDATYHEKLEFIGDAILDFMVVRYIFSRGDQLSPGAMTMLKGAMVSNSTLAAICVLSGLYHHLHYDSYPLGPSIETYVKQLELRRVQEMESATREKRSPGQYWLDIEPPKALSDLVESMIGALFISDDYQPVGADFFFGKVLKPFYDQHITLTTLSHHPTKILFELLQKHGCQHFELVKERCDVKQETRCDVVVHDIILASATAPTVHAASRAASMAALDALEGDPHFMNRTCACRSGPQGMRARKTAIEEMLADLGDEATL